MKRSFKILRMKSWSHEVTPGYLGDPCLLYSKTLLEGTCCPNVMTTEQQMGVHWPWLCGARTGACETQAWQKPRSQCGRWMSHQWLHWCFWHFKRFTLCLKFHQFYINFLLEISTSKVLRVTFTCLWKKVSMWMNLHCLHLFTHFWLTCCFSFIVTSWWEAEPFMASSVSMHWWRAAGQSCLLLAVAEPPGWRVAGEDGTKPAETECKRKRTARSLAAEMLSAKKWKEKFACW